MLLLCGAVMKKAALALMLIFALLFSSVELVKIAEANFMWIFATVEPVPGTIPPSISIIKPQNNTSCSSNNITVNFSVKTAELSGWPSFIHTVGYSLDGGNLIPVDNSEVLELFDAALNLTLLPSGKHSLTVTAEVVVYRGEPMEKFLLDTNSTVYFSIGSADYSSTPSPSSTATPSPSPEPTIPTSPTPLPSEEPQQIGQIVIFGLIITVAVLAVGLGLLVYLIKRK